MSETFLVNMQCDNINYNELNSLANEIIIFALRNKLGIHFNELGYSTDFTKLHQMKNYFFVSDSFLHCNASFLNISSDANLSNLDYKSNFYNNISFAYEMLSIIQKFGISNIEIYISSDSIFEDENDFIVLNSSKEDLLDKVYQTLIDNSNEFAYEFPPIKINISTKN